MKPRRAAGIASLGFGKSVVVDLNSFHVESAFSREKNYFHEPHV